MAFSLHMFCGFEYGLAGAHIGSAAAEIPAESLFHVLARRVGMAVQEILRGDHETRRAIPALLGVMLNERRGYRVHLGVVGEAFDGLDVFALRVDGERGAAIDCLAVDDGSASAAGTAITHAF